MSNEQPNIKVKSVEVILKRNNGRSIEYDNVAAMDFVVKGNVTLLNIVDTTNQVSEMINMDSVETYIVHWE